MGIPDRTLTAEQHLAMEQAYQDKLIAERLPGWLGRLDSVQLDAVSQALKACLVHRHQLATRLAGLQPVDAFVKRALNQALAGRYERDVDVDLLYLRRWYYYFTEKPTWATGRWPQMDRDYTDTPLYQAALNNFTAQEAAGEGEPRRNGLFDVLGKELGQRSAADFAGLCRKLDLGAAYQQHLDGVLDDAFRATLAQMLRQGLLVDAYRARSDGALDDRELELIITLAKESRLQQLDGSVVRYRQLQLSGCDVQQVIVLQVLDEGLLRNTTRRILVYIPGDRNGAWSGHPSLQGFIGEVLEQRLGDRQYQQFFRRFIKLRDQQRFFAAYTSGSLTGHLLSVSEALFDHLPAARIAQIKDDAAMLVTPTAQVDRALQAQRDQQFKQQGWVLGTLAGLFVPALGGVMLAVTVWELLGEVFQGIDDWREGDTQAALEHLTKVARDAALVALTGVAIGLARRAWTGSSFVDGLVPTQLEDGSEKLWDQNLQAYRRAAPGADSESDALGIHAEGEHDLVELDGHWYSIVQRSEDEQWQIRPQQGHGPLLRHNGAGAWRLWCERPSHWADPRYLFRRLGSPFSQLSDRQVDQVLANQGLASDDLRALHMYGRAPEPALVDAVLRARLAGRVAQLIEHLRAGRVTEDSDALAYARALPGAASLPGPALGELAWASRQTLWQQWYEDLQLPESASIATLRRAFPSLHVLGADAVLRAATDADRQALLDSGRITPRLARLARAGAIHARVSRAIEAMQIDTPQHLDLARVVLQLFEHLTLAASGPAWRLFDGQAPGPLLTTRGTGTPHDLVHRHGRFALRDAQGLSLGEPGELFEVMSRALAAAQWQALGLAEPVSDSLRQALVERAVEQRAQLPAMLGVARQPAWWVAPQRVGKCVGYPLSCCPGWFDAFTFRPRSLAARVAELYPDFDDDEPQIRRWLEDVRESGRDVALLIGELEQQLQVLNRQLKAWAHRAPTARQRQARREFRHGLLDCWRYIVPQQSYRIRYEEGYSWRWIGRDVDELPELPVEVSLPHVRVLQFEQSGLKVLPDGFLRAFPNVCTLELMGNNLQRLPAQLAQLSRLQSLDLYDNQIELDPFQSTLLASCESLLYLNLSRNPLRANFSVQAMRDLVELRLRDTGITHLPLGALELQDLQVLDVGGNRIRELPEGFYDAPVWRRGQVTLEGNELSPAERERLVEARASRGMGTVQSAPGNVPTRLLWLDRLGHEQRAPFAALWSRVEDEDGCEQFFSLLKELTQSADFSGAKSSDLARRVMNIMQQMADFASLREELFAASQIETCGDGAAIHFSELEVRALVWHAEHEAAGASQAQVLARLARRLLRLARLNAYALRDFRSRQQRSPELEEIEVVLAYNIHLRDELDLPINTQMMRFPASALVDARRAAQAAAWVTGQETDDDLAEWMVQCRFWQRYLEKAHAQALRVPDHYRKQLAALHSEAEIQALQAVIEVDQHERKLALTRQALQGMEAP
ncbi:NEL-type E3 ubiquitin ligase domain-containing protein [Pseudomonas sp. NPDC089428]|uniref:NEL-type E3 ubiquitin ligase domain-containing protein n=1 Tax=Pseudomonas sp. NPDC089428 TaxID=3364467 RepID=UPI0038111587